MVGRTQNTADPCVLSNLFACQRPMSESCERISIRRPKANFVIGSRDRFRFFTSISKIYMFRFRLCCDSNDSIF